MEYQVVDKKVNITLSPKNKRIGVMVSGGIDSALLYYLLLAEKNYQKSDHIIYPIVMFRQEGSRFFSRPIIDRINEKFKITCRAKRFGNEKLPNHLQIESAMIQAANILRLNAIYVGVIKTRPEHFVGYTNIPIPDSEYIVTPFSHLEKDYIIKLYYDLGIDDLLPYTFSCDINEQHHCGQCNGCNERRYGFEKNKKLDISLNFK